jgi:hypothetical protein
MTVIDAIDLDVDVIATEIGIPFEFWAHQCHGISNLMIQHDIVQGRVARGWMPGVPSQHSWVVVGDDCYAKDAHIVDPTLWSYRNDVAGIWQGVPTDLGHTPHGAGSIWKSGRPPYPTGEIIELELPDDSDGKFARLFLERIVGPLDMDGWRFLLHAPVEGWPAKEIHTAAQQNKLLRHIAPIDIVGMITDLNPKGLYLKVDK